MKYPRGLTVDVDCVYVVDRYNHRIQVFDKTNGAFITQWGSRGKDLGQFHSPYGVAVLGARIYVTDSSNNRVQIFK